MSENNQPELRLLPCPFCGDDAVRFSEGGYNTTGCHRCQVWLPEGKPVSQERADLAWNTRAIDSLRAPEPKKQCLPYCQCIECKTARGEVSAHEPSGDLEKLVEEALSSYRLNFTQDSLSGDPLPLVDALTPASQKTIELGKKERDLLGEHIIDAIGSYIHQRDKALAQEIRGQEQRKDEEWEKKLEGANTEYKIVVGKLTIERGYSEQLKTQLDEAKKDKDRLDWLEETAFKVHINQRDDEDFEVKWGDLYFYGKTLRLAIDSAMKDNK